MRCVAAFRTYSWDDDVAELARRFFAASPGTRHVVLADETRGKLPVLGYEVISYTEDTSALGLPAEPAGISLWFNVDYTLYALRRALPDYDYYLVSESDVAVNLPLAPMLAAAGEFDHLAHDTKPAAPDWYWRYTADGVFPQLWQTLLFFTLSSGKVLDLLLAERQRLARAFAAGSIKNWPFCEVFVASVLAQAGLRVAEAGRFADARHLNYRPRVEISDPKASAPGTLVHSVVGRETYLRDICKEFGPQAWFDPASPLGVMLARYRLADYAQPLIAAFEAAGEHSGLQAFLAELARHGMGVKQGPDLALRKPALSSSVSPWSRHNKPHRDACGAVTSTLMPEFGFHTNEEDEPWWMVDLLAVSVIDEIRIINRPVLEARLGAFVVESSVDGANWALRYAHLSGAVIPSDPRIPARLVFPEPVVAKLVRIRKLERGMLHLRRVQVFGRVLPPKPEIPLP